MPFITQILGTGTGQYWGDQNGNPIMMKSDTPWALAYNGGNSGGATTYQTDITNYCSIRSGQGFNCFLINAPGTSQTGTTDNGNTWDGVAPFTSPGVLNNTFWTRVDYAITTAASYGMTVILNPMFEYCIADTGGSMHSWTNANFTTYGTNLGNRYGSAPNLIWEFGDDYGDGNDSFLTNCLSAIRATGDTHLISVENLTPGTSRFSMTDNSSFAWGTSNAQFNWCYNYGTSYLSVEYAYQESSPLLVMKMDGNYDSGTSGNDPRIYWRNWAWWALSSGSRGFQYGRTDVYPWPAGMISGNVLTVNTPDNSDFAKFWGILGSLPGWYKLVPDTSSALVTAGRGTRWPVLNGGAEDVYTTASSNTYVTASKTPDGKLAVIYNPAANTQTITVNGSLMVPGYTATWIDPTSGATSSAGISSTYTKSAVNSTGDHDWLLVLQASATQAAQAPVQPMPSRRAYSAAFSAGNRGGGHSR